MSACFLSPSQAETATSAPACVWSAHRVASRAPKVARCKMCVRVCLYLLFIALTRPRQQGLLRPWTAECQLYDPGSDVLEFPVSLALNCSGLLWCARLFLCALPNAVCNYLLSLDAPRSPASPAQPCKAQPSPAQPSPAKSSPAQTPAS